MFYLYGKCVAIVVIQHRGILKNARACILLPFQSLSMHRSVLES